MYHKRELAMYRGEEIAPHNGRNIVLTIDAGVQHILETELAEAAQKYSPSSACGIVVRPRTGEIVAMATVPTFDPNNPGATQPDTWRNRVITDTYEPGSTFKIVAVSGALNDGLVTLQSQFDCWVEPSSSRSTLRTSVSSQSKKIVRLSDFVSIT